MYKNISKSQFKLIDARIKEQEYWSCVRAVCVFKVTSNILLISVTSLFLQIRSEAQLCTCHNPFRIVKVGDGKYTFGSSKIIRLVRIHGSSIVVRVGGGWEYLYDFLLKTDPCRGENFMIYLPVYLVETSMLPPTAK